MFKFIFIMGFFLLYIWLIAPGRGKKEQRAYFCSWNYAHRGFYDNEAGIPENSLRAFDRAVTDGYGIELDVQMTKDRRLVVFHDDSLKRVCGIDAAIREFDYEELRTLYLFDTREQIPLLSQVLTLVDGRVPILVEIKLDSIDMSICHYTNLALKGYRGSYCLESFNPLVLFWFRRHNQKVFRGQLSGNLLKEPGHGVVLHFLITNLLVNFLGRPDFIAYRCQDMRNVSFQVVRGLLQAPVFAWTIDSHQAYKKYRQLFDAVIFEGFDLR